MNRRIITSFILIFSSLICNSIFGQLNSYKHFISPQYNIGFIGDPGYDYQHLVNDFVKSFALNIGKRTFGETSWDAFYKKPEIGISILHYNLGNKQQLGTVTGVHPYIEMKPFRFTRFYPSLKFGIGAVYATKKFDRLNNYENTLVASHINAVINAELNLNVLLTPRIGLKTGIAFTHFSNGNTIIPNNGYNIPSLSGGLKYYFSPYQQKETTEITNPKKENQWFVSFSTSVTNRMREVSGGFNYYNILTEYYFNSNSPLSVGIGADLSFNNAEATNLREAKNYPAYRFNPGIKLAVKFSFGDLDLVGQGGVTKDKNFMLYEWIIIRYHFLNRFFTQVSYRTYYDNGDHLSWGGGIVL